MASIPIYESRLGPIDVAFNHSHGIVPVGLGPCSKAVHILQRHQEGGYCWGAFQSQWLNQGDTSVKCVNQSNLSQFDGYYTYPQSNISTTQDVEDNPVSLEQTQMGINNSLRNPVNAECQCSQTGDAAISGGFVASAQYPPPSSGATEMSAYKPSQQKKLRNPHSDPWTSYEQKQTRREWNLYSKPFA